MAPPQPRPTRHRRGPRPAAARRTGSAGKLSPTTRIAIGLAAFTLLILGAASARTVDNDTCNGRSCIQVGTFNLYWLGSAERFQQGLRTQEDVNRLADLISGNLDLEVVVFEEVNTSINEQSDSVTTKSTQQWAWLRQRLRRAGYSFYEGTTGWAQRLVIAYHKKSVKLLRKQTLLVSTSFDFGPDCMSSSARAPIAAEFRADKLEFWVIGVHMKSRRNGSCSDRIRQQQTEELAAAIVSQLSAEAGHVFLAGDFNAPGKDPTLRPLTRGAGFKPLTRRGNRAAGSGDVSYLIDPFRSLIDHVMYRKRDSRRTWVRKSTVVFDPTMAGDEFADFARDYSDHAPVYTSFYTDEP